jgi:GT2 family glycosyltransferase
MVSIIVVNYNSSTLLKECYSSVISTIGDQSFEFIVVDSGSRKEEVDNLMDLERVGVRIILIRGNVGYAKAVNEGIKNAKYDFILITNPDVVYKPDSIRIMMNTLLRLPRCGAVGPKTWWNSGMTFLLPMSEFFTPYWLFRKKLMNTSRTMRDLILRGWIKRTLRYWGSDSPIEQEMLAGACIMTTNKVLDRVGGFDDSFSLYFEDTDWCLRVRKAGYRLYTVPRANIIHYYNQSAKQDAGSAGEKFDDSLNKYMRKHFGNQYALLRRFQRFGAFSGNETFLSFEDIGRFSEPPVFCFKDRSKKLLLLSPVDTLIPSAGAFIEGDSFRIPGDLWGLLGAGRYFAMAINLESARDKGSWTWAKL